VAPIDRELIATAGSALRDTASLLAGGDARPDIDQLESCRQAAIAQLKDLNSQPPSNSPQPGHFSEAAQIAFHAAGSEPALE
jgi:hypothetical protein